MKRGFYIIMGLVAACLRVLAQDGASNLEFVENKGQWDARVQFKAELPNGALFLEKQGFSVLLYDTTDLKAMTNAHHGVAASAKGVGSYKSVGATGSGGTALPGTMLRAHAYRVSFMDASPNVEIFPDKPLPGYNNYFIGNDPAKWASECRVFQGVTYKNLYPNIDVRYYTNNGQLKYDIIVHPGGDVSKVRLNYAGADQLNTHKGRLNIHTSVGTITELAPVSFLSNAQGRTDIRCKYSIKNGNTVSFDVPDHDADATLVIDPTIVFVTFTGSKVSNWGFTATPGPDGSFFAGGIVFGAAFPYTTGQLEPVYGGGSFDVGIIKFNSIGSTKVYATYLGGNDSETPHSLVCDAQGNLVVLGRTYSVNFPFKTSAGPGGAADMFVTKLNAAGSAIIGSMRIGGSGNDCVNMNDQARNQSEHTDSLIRNYGDDSRSEVVLDAQNNILVAASSQSYNFPTTGKAFQPRFGGGTQDGVVLKIDPNCGSLIWASFLGGTGADAGFVLKADPVTGDIYVAGATSSTDFPGNKSGVIQAGYGGGTCDGFVAQISADGATIIRSTYMGTNASDAIYGLQFDKHGFPYVMGTTYGTWPVVNVLYSIGGARQFVSKLQPDLSAFVYSTTFGTGSSQSRGNPNISPVAFLVDRCENVYVSGWGGWIIGGESDPYGLLGTSGMPTTSDATKRVSDNRDFYFIVLKKNASQLLYGTFFGENDNSHSISEHVDGGTSRYDQNGVIYQAICANCSGPSQTGRYPTTPGVWAPVNGAGSSGGCNLAAVKISFNFAGVAAGLRASVNGRLGDTSGCIPMDTQLQDTIRNAKSYIFSFGDGSPDVATTSYVVEHLYPNPGVYTVMMVAIDSNSCNVADTSYRHVIARTDRALVDFTLLKDPAAPCTSLDWDFTNTSTPPAGKPFSVNSFLWDFGDGTGQVPDNLTTLSHSFPAPGTYTISLILRDTAYCNYPDTATHDLRVSPIAKAQFITPSTGCAPYPAMFNNTSLGGITFNWNFGDPASGADNTSTDVNPVHLYQNPGTYTITLHEEDPSTCNKVSDTSFTITVNVKPKAAFTYQPIPPIANKPLIFQNLSIDGFSYEWGFGDGDTVTKTSMDTVMHLYNETDSFQVCLMTTNEFACTDTACQQVQALIDPLLDVPNAFTPGRFGQNAIIKVMGFGILRMDFRIYNRWGKLIFESDNPDVGWDGTYLGQPQPMDVYAYTLEAEFTNGVHVSKKGDITLLR